MADHGEPGAPTEALELTAPTPSPRRRRALWGALGAIAVAAGALVVSSTGDDGAPRDLPIALGADGDASRNEAATMAADRAMLAPVTYIAGDDLPALGGEAPAYRLAGEVSGDEVTRLARALDLDGAPEQRDGLWHLTTDDGTLEVYGGNGGSWWYSNIPAPEVTPLERGSTSSGGGSAGVEGCAPDLPPVEMDRCLAAQRPVVTTTVPRPEDLPSEDEARRIALELLEATGVDVSDAHVTVEGPHDAWYIAVEPRLDGQIVSGLVASVSVGEDGVVQHASGFLADPEALGDYPVLDTRAAIDRLNDLGGGFGGLAARSGVAVDTPEAAIDVAVPAQASTTIGAVPDSIGAPTTAFDGAEVPPDVADGRVDEICAATSELSVDDAGATSADEAAGTTTSSLPISDVDCPAPEPFVEPEPIEIVLHEAERSLVVVPAFDGSGDAYLVPAYRFRGDDGAVVDGIAVDDDSLAPPPRAPDPMPLPAPDPGGSSEPGGPGCASPPPGPDGAVADICIDPGTADLPADVRPSEPISDPDGPVSSP